MFRVGILTISDKGAAGERADGSGPELQRLLDPQLYEVSHYQVVPDDWGAIVAALVAWSDAEGLDLILTSGGTGFSPRDITPEATLSVADRLAPGLPEAMRAASLTKTPHAMLSRGVAALRGATLIINLPGSPKGARENLAVVLPALPHALEKLHGDPRDCAS
jgi:molybdenum cofactor synthesis domain-containing protein